MKEFTSDIPSIIEHEYGFSDVPSLVSILKSLKEKPILTMHTLPFDKPQLEFIGKKSKLVTIMCEQFSFCSMNGVESTLIPHGIPEYKFTNSDREAAREENGIKPDDIVICLHGFLNPEKGIETAVGAIHYVKRKIPRVRFLLVGGLHPLAPRTFKTHSYFRGILKALPEGSILKLGVYTSRIVDKLLLTSDIFLLPLDDSRMFLSPSGTACKEMGFGRPIIKSKSYRAGFVPGDSYILHPREFSEAIIQLIRDDKKYNSLCEEIRRYALENSWGNSAARHLEVVNNA